MTVILFVQDTVTCCDVWVCVNWNIDLRDKAETIRQTPWTNIGRHRRALLAVIVADAIELYMQTPQGSIGRHRKAPWGYTQKPLDGAL